MSNQNHLCYICLKGTVFFPKKYSVYPIYFSTPLVDE
jgi:hypothetical protein